MPALVVALRPLSRSYQHVLEWFAKFNEHFSLVSPDGYNLSSVSNMTKSELAVFKSVDLEVSLIVHALTKDNKFIRPTWFTSSFVHATNICEVTLRLDLHNLMYFNDKMGFILEFPFWLQGFKALKKVKVEIPICFESKPRHYKIMHMMTERLSAKLGVKGVMVDQLGPQYNLRAEVWVWEVAEGEKLMDWTQELGRAWRRLSREPREHWAGFFPWNLHAYKGELGMENGGFVIENWSTYYDRGWIYYR